MEHRKIAEDAAARWTDAHAVMHRSATAPQQQPQAAALEVLLKTSSEEIVTFARMAHWMVRAPPLTPVCCVVVCLFGYFICFLLISILRVGLGLQVLGPQDCRV